MPLVQWIQQNLSWPSYIGSGTLTIGGSAACRIVSVRYTYVGSGSIAVSGHAPARIIPKEFHYVGSGSIRITGSSWGYVKKLNTGRAKRLFKFDIGDTVFDITGYKWVVFEAFYTHAANQYQVIGTSQEEAVFDERELFSYLPTEVYEPPVLNPVPPPVPGTKKVFVYKSPVSDVLERLQRMQDAIDNLQPVPTPQPGRRKVRV